METDWIVDEVHRIPGESDWFIDSSGNLIFVKNHDGVTYNGCAFSAGNWRTVRPIKSDEEPESR